MEKLKNHFLNNCASVIIYIIPRVFYFAKNLFGSVLPILIASGNVREAGSRLEEQRRCDRPPSRHIVSKTHCKWD